MALAFTPRQYQRLPTHHESGQGGGMQVGKQLRSVWSTIKAHPTVSWAFAVVAVIGSVDTFSGIFTQLTDVTVPTVNAVTRWLLMDGSHILPWWGWLMVLQAILTVGLFLEVRRLLLGISRIHDDISGNVTAQIAKQDAWVKDQILDIQTKHRELDDKVNWQSQIVEGLSAQVFPEQKP